MIKISRKELEEFFRGDINLLLMNLNSGLLPEYLQKDEVDMLVARFGNNWFEEL